MLKQYEGIEQITISIDALRTMFCIQPYEYSRYNDFKRKVLLQAQKEINLDKTDISLDFKEIKTGRKVTSIKFYIKL
ncbi:replication initiation protein [Clostridium tagluense]|uniref:replication initiation protein n=1 Tax=Clostridium tagluense TaxID=360422 RepID=UPI002DD425A5|nr:replication initiation protein [Clostridium tagluense]